MLKSLRIEKWYSWVLVALLAAFLVFQHIAFKAREEKLVLNKESLESNLGEMQVENERLGLELEDKIYIIESFEGQIRSISGVVGNLQKLKETDEELLRKYSKAYFLNENYVPARLEEISESYLYHAGTPQLVHADTWPFLEEMLKAARADGVEILVSSAFRSFGTQASLKSSYTVTYGSGANRFSADQGFSEHQLGTAVDLATRASGPASVRFETDQAYTWLLGNAHRFGFTLSYPKGNSYYIFEPWHWRFVGIELATRLREEGKHFYDLDQREIDTYLIKLFDQARH